MIKRLQFSGAYLVFWLVYFILCRGLFLLFHADMTARLPLELIFGAFLHGLRMDVAFSSYMSVIPFIMTALTVIVPARFIKPVVKYYTFGCLFFITFLVVTDCELFGIWGFRLDSTVLMYINTPKEMLVSAGSSPLILLIPMVFMLAFLAGRVYLGKVHTLCDGLPDIPPASIVLFVFMTALLIIPIRGGFQLAPMNQSAAYFSRVDFANQAALNVPWTLFYSLLKKTYDTTNPYEFMDYEKAEDIVRDFYSAGGKGKAAAFLKTERPNVLIILWESLTAKVVTSLGGVSGVTPEFDRLAGEGMLFSNCYANADRSAGGIIAVLSGYPSLPRQRIIKMPNKTVGLPSLAKSFNSAGYATSFYYGGELEFANIKSYLLNSKFDRLIGKDSFAPEDWNSKWGAHDHVVLDKFIDDIDKESKPFFSVIFTLSSHEPFEVPMQTEIEGDDIDSQFLNSLRYTDRSIGDFIEKAKSTSWYDNTLVIIVSDHGHNRPGNSQRYDPEKFHIPMLWLGGALSVRDSVITRICSQTDIAAALLNRTGIRSEDYPWSRDIFNPATSSCAHYVFNNGMVYIDEGGSLIFDNTGGSLISRDSSVTDDDIELSKAHLQMTYKDFLDR